MFAKRVLVCSLLVYATVSAYTTTLKQTAGPTGTRVYAEGVNPPAHQQKPAGKTVWAYSGAATQGAFGQVYHPDGLVQVKDVLNTPVNQIAFIANVDVTNKPTGWFAPGRLNSGGCGQSQTYELPFGYECKRPDGQPHADCDDSASLDTFQGNLKQLHDAGITLTLTLGSWCTQLPVLESERWSAEDFDKFVGYFQEIRMSVFGGYLDGIDFDWEAFCTAGCLKDTCRCGWDDHQCGTKSPEQLAAGVYYNQTNLALSEDGKEIEQIQRYQCWVLPTTHTMQVMTGITHAMKKAGHVVTLVPMSTALYSGDAGGSSGGSGGRKAISADVSRNEYVKYRKQNVGDGGAEVDLLDLADGVMLQWYSGFDASLCRNGNDPKDCSCDNKPAADYPNIVDAKDGLVMYPWQTQYNLAGRAFPTSFPLRCQACGKDVYRLDNKTGEWGWGEYACTPEDETWFVPCSERDGKGAGLPECTAQHNNGVTKYATQKKSAPHWFPKSVEIGSKCPRGIDCPDWRYEGEEDYSRQLKLLQSISSVVDLNKVTIGFETLGVDVLVQMEAYADQALPWSTAGQKEHQFPTEYDKLVFYHKCTQNMTADNYAQEKRCASVLGWQQWGPQFRANDVVGLESAVDKVLHKQLSGVGLFTLDGVVAQDKKHKKRFWCEQLMRLNETYQLPCRGDTCNSYCGADHDAPAPAPKPSDQHGIVYVASGDSCSAIADKECGTGTPCSSAEICPAICNSAEVCANLQVGAELHYDCSLERTHCSG